MSMIVTVRNADGHHHDVIEDDFNCDYQDEKEEDENGSYISRIFSLPSLPVQVVSSSFLPHFMSTTMISRFTSVREYHQNCPKNQ